MSQNDPLSGPGSPGLRGGAGIVRRVEIQVLGSGGPQGWPAPGCRCAACQQAEVNGTARIPLSVLVNGQLKVHGTEAGRADGHRVRQLAGGWDVTGPDGSRLLAGPSPEVPADAGRYDAVLLDLIGDPGQLGRLRRRGAVTGATLVLAGFADHRIRSERELARRCGFWGAVPVRDGDVHTVPGPGAAGRGTAVRRPWRVLVLGGSGSGKSAEAELRLAAEPEVTYVATGRVDPADPEWTARIAAHVGRRPSWWGTRESTDVAGVLAAFSGAVLVDSVTTWLAGVMDDCGAWDDAAGRAAARERADGLVAAWRAVDGYVVAVSDETGLGVVPDTRAGRMFRDELGRLNQRLAAEADEFVLVVAGRPMLSAG
jgi:adenosylcobinamide kinase/adenosylcobinamide-phosphate guanylyltransferase